MKNNKKPVLVLSTNVGFLFAIKPERLNLMFKSTIKADSIINPTTLKHISNFQFLTESQTALKHQDLSSLVMLTDKKDLKVIKHPSWVRGLQNGVMFLGSCQAQQLWIVLTSNKTTSLTEKFNLYTEIAIYLGVQITSIVSSTSVSICSYDQVIPS